MSSIYIVMPAYNEAANIEETIKQWYPIVDKLHQEGVKTELIIANDGSKDNTFLIMQEIKRRFPLFRPLNKPNSGHGATILYLYRYAIENNVDFIFQTDSDGQTIPSEFWQMWNNREKFDFQIGYRNNMQDGLSRVLVTKVLRIVVWIMFRKLVKDANTPFRLMKVDKLIPIMNVIPQDFFLSNVVISAIATKWNYKIGWYNITFKPRQGGKNSINIKRIINIGWNALSDFRKINRNLKGTNR
ncbi:MAG: glycosyltransferase family 2 protein [Phocaeicola sp.]|nr:glycosyltransferase family 2 protein [Phocaeicola sp.]